MSDGLDWYVYYRVSGVVEEQRAGPYASRQVAEEHQRDISSFDGIRHVTVIQKVTYDEQSSIPDRALKEH